MRGLRARRQRSEWPRRRPARSAVARNGEPRASSPPVEEHLGRPIQTHVADFAAMLPSRGVSKSHAADRRRGLREFMKACRVHTPRGLDPSKAERGTGDLKVAGSDARAINRRRRATS